MDETVISITAPNIVTITVMAAIGFVVLGFILATIAKMGAGKSDA